VRRRCEAPDPGPRPEDFRRIASGGVKDRLNAHPLALKWFHGRLLVGSLRSEFALEGATSAFEIAPVEGAAGAAGGARIYGWSGETGVWTEFYRTPSAPDADGALSPREAGICSVAEFGSALCFATLAGAPGGRGALLQCTDKLAFESLPLPSEFGDGVFGARALTAFKGRLFATAADPDAAGFNAVLETKDPTRGRWTQASEKGFGEAENLRVVRLAGFGERLYAATANPAGYQIWRTDAEGRAPYRWEKVIEQGAWRGPLSPSVGSLLAFKDALYVGSGMTADANPGAPSGGSGPEIIRVRADGAFDLVVGEERMTPHGRRRALSAFGPGFDTIGNGAISSLGTHKGWLYAGLHNWALMMNYVGEAGVPDLTRRFFDRLGPKEVAERIAGAKLYRSADGENWLPVTTGGFGNPFNCSVSSIESTPFGVAVGAANPFAPLVASFGVDGKFEGYVDNPDGGFEIWLGERA
jgi:hypothetical protein